MKYRRKYKYKDIEVQLASVENSGISIRYIHNPSEAVIEQLLKTMPNIFYEYFEE